jgi:signal peptidase I
MDQENNDTAPSKPRTGLATISLVLGIFSFLTLGLLEIGAAAGVVTGVMALSRARRDPARYSGFYLALSGVILSGISAILSIAIAPLIITFLVQPAKFEGTSMSPALNNGDRIFLGKQIDRIDRGDIVAFWYPDNPSQTFVKRIIGLPGETLRIDSRGQVFINGVPINEPYLRPEGNRYPRAMLDTFIKPHYYFVMGDNRDISNDSRSWGLVPEKYIYGKYLWRYYSAE